MFGLEESSAFGSEEFWVQFLERLIKRSLILIVFLLPFIINPLGYHIFTLPKAIFLRVISLTVFLSWLSLIILTQGKYSFRRSFLDKPIFFYLFFAAISTLFSLNFHTAFYGTFYRFEGFLSLLIYIFLFYAALNFFQDENEIKLLLTALFLSASIISLVGIFQVFKPIFYDSSATGLDVGRVGSFFGNSNYLGAYLSLVVPLVLGINLFSRELKFNRWLSSGTLILTFLCLIFTYTRASWLGVILAVCLMVFVLREKILKPKGLVFILLLVILVGLLVFTLAGFEGWIKVYERLSSIFELKDSAAGRVFIWRISLKIVRNYWFIGVGPDSIGLVFPRHLPINWLAVSERAFTDKAHSDILQVAVCQGIVGLIGYLWLFGSFFVLGFKKIARIVEEKKKLISLSLFWAALAYFINLQFSFTMVEVTPIFWVLAGILVSIEEDRIRIISFKRLSGLFKKRGVKLFLFALIGALFLIGVYNGSKTLLADAYVRDAIEWSEVGASDQEIQQYLKATKLDSSEGKYFYFLGLACFDRAKREKSENELERAIVSFKKGIELNQHDVLNYLGLERAYLLGGKIFDKAMLDKSIETIKKGLKIALYLPELWYDLGQAYEEKGLVKDAIEAYTMSLRIDESNNFAREKIQILKEEN